MPKRTSIGIRSIITNHDDHDKKTTVEGSGYIFVNFNETRKL